MSKRGNLDYFKTAGHASEDRDVGERAKRRLSVAKKRARVPHKSSAPSPEFQAPALAPVAPPPVRSGRRVQGYAERLVRVLARRGLIETRAGLEAAARWLDDLASRIDRKRVI